MHYSNIFFKGNNLYHIYFDDKGVRRRKIIDDWKVKLYADTNIISTSKQFMEEKKENLEEIVFSSYKDYKQFKKSNKMPFYDDFGEEYKFLFKTYNGEIDFNIKNFKIFSLDIEAFREDGFPDKPLYPIPCLTVYSSKEDRYHTFWFSEKQSYSAENSILPFKEKIISHGFTSEKKMLDEFLDWWQKEACDIVTGWNIYFDVNYIYKRAEVLGLKNSKMSAFNMAYILEKLVEDDSGQVRKVERLHIRGMTILDYYELYTKFIQNKPESNKLDFIAEIELGENKLSFPEYPTLRELYNDFQKYVDYNIKDTYLVWKIQEKKEFIDLAITLAYRYFVNIEDVLAPARSTDVLISKDLWDDNIGVPPKIQSKKVIYEGAVVKTPTHTGFALLIDIFDVVSFYPSTHVSFNIDPFKKIFHLDKELLIIKRDLINHMLNSFGKELKPDVFKRKRNELDNLIISYGEPEAWGEEQVAILKKRKINITANGAFFDAREEGRLSKIIKIVFDKKESLGKRKDELKREIKNAKPEDVQRLTDLLKKTVIQREATKVQLNAIYGAFGSLGFRYADEDISEAITITCKYIILSVATELNKRLQEIKKWEQDYCFYGDTDSLFFELYNIIDISQDNQKIVEDTLKLNSEIIEPLIAETLEKLVSQLNGIENFYVMANESISDVGILRSKKKYIMRKLYDEGMYCTKPEFKIKGLDIVRSEISSVIRKQVKKIIEDILDKGKTNANSMYTLNSIINEAIVKHKEEFKKMPLEHIAKNIGVNGLTKYYNEKTLYNKGAPYQVKASLHYNKYLETHKKGAEYTRIQNGDKVKILYLKLNPLVPNDAVAFINKFPPELIQYIDYEKQFTKTMFAILSKIFEVLDIKIYEDVSNIKKLTF